MIRLLSLTLLLLVSTTDFQTTCRKKNEPLQTYFKWEKNKKLIMAHRTTPVSGYSENTLAAMQHAYQVSPCATQEIDVRMSKDSVLLLLHDATLERTTTGKGPLNEFTYQELRTLELKDESGKVLKGQPIPTLDELLTFAKNKIVLFLDMKPGTDPERMMRTLEKHQMVNDVVVICYTVAEAQQLHRQYPSLMMALGFNDEKAIDAITKSGIPYKNLVALTPSKVQPASFYDRIHQMGIMTSWGANNTIDHFPFSEAKTKYQEALLTGADIICTDSLERVQSLFVASPQSTSKKR